MYVVCPACSKQHSVSEKLAGKRAKCGCGEIMTIPAAPVAEAAADDWLNESFDATTTAAPASNLLSGGMRTPTSGQPAPSGAGPILFQCEYGIVRPWIFGLFGINLVTATFAIWAGIFWNKGWSMNNARLPPWSVTVMFEFVGWGLMIVIVSFFVGYFIRLNKPQRVAVTASGMIIPENNWSVGERLIPWAEATVKLMSFGPIRQLQFKQGWRSLKVLVSSQFPSETTSTRFLATCANMGSYDGELLRETQTCQYCRESPPWRSAEWRYGRFRGT
ncbi:MAG: hypothetical protein CMJ64_17515 [Planctomycetaceae bacterium]|nr:hypothetical protein [Planctomycetaceae bacterium]